jgi:hypothetical protein
MFAGEFRQACEARDRVAICRLIASVPEDRWTFPDRRAEASYDSVRVCVHWLSGGSGINTYKTVSVAILWPDGSSDFAGQYSAEELPLPNYIPRWQRASGSHSIGI